LESAHPHLGKREAIVNGTNGGNALASPRRIELSGEYDLNRKEELGLLFATLPADGRAVIDLSRVTYVDSTFLHELVSLHLRLKEHGVTLVGANSAIRRVLDIVGFDQLFRIAES
jgi:anti-sigma B factor antagonist